MQDINLYHLLKFYAKKWMWIVLLTVIGAIGGFIYNTYIQVPLYKSDATLLLVNTDSAKVAQNTTLINNYIELLKSRRVLEPVLDHQNHVMSYDALAEAITSTNDKGTEVIKVSIATKDADTSKKLADGVVMSFRDEVKDIYNLDNVSVVDNASQPTTPYNVHQAMYVILAAAAGFFLSIIALFFIYDLKSSKQAAFSTEAVEETKPKAKTKVKAKKAAQPAAKVETETVIEPIVKNEVKIVPRKRAASNPLARRAYNLLVGALDDQPLGYVKKDSDKDKNAEL